MSKKPTSAAKSRPEKAASIDLFADLSISGSRISSAKASENERSRSAGTTNANKSSSQAGPVPKIPVIDAQDLTGMEMDVGHPSPIAEEDGEVLAMSTSDADFWFDSIIGHIEDIIMGRIQIDFFSSKNLW